MCLTFFLFALMAILFLIKSLGRLKYFFIYEKNKPYLITQEGTMIIIFWIYSNINVFSFVCHFTFMFLLDDFISQQPAKLNCYLFIKSQLWKKNHVFINALILEDLNNIITDIQFTEKYTNLIIFKLEC